MGFPEVDRGHFDWWDPTDLLWLAEAFIYFFLDLVGKIRIALPFKYGRLNHPR